MTTSAAPLAEPAVVDVPELLHSRPLGALPLLGPGDIDDVLDALEDLAVEAEVARAQDADLHSEGSAAELRQRLEALRRCALDDVECLAAAGLLDAAAASLASSAGVPVATLLGWRSEALLPAR